VNGGWGIRMDRWQKMQSINDEKGELEEALRF
jgi:hypothetical protein